MKKIRIVGAAVLLLGGVATLGCGADGSDQFDEPTNTSEEAVITLGAATLDSTTCTGARTVCNGMHCCPPGFAMTALNVGENIFQCRRVLGAPTDASLCKPEGSFTRPVEGWNVRACRDGSYMNGLHAGNNTITCCPYGFPFSPTRTLDGAGEAAFQVTAPRIKKPGFWAGVCETGSMHACPPRNGAPGVMEGFSIGNNMNVCAY